MYFLKCQIMETVNCNQEKRELTLDLGQGWFHGEGLKTGPEFIHS